MSNVSLVNGHIDRTEIKDENVIKALELLVERVRVYRCENVSISKKTLEKTFDLINRQKAEIERLHALCKPTETSGYRIENGKVVFYTKILNGYRHEYESLDRVVNDMNIMLQNAYKTDEIASHYKGKLQTAKSEAIKEFAERVKKVMVATHKDINGYCRYETEDYYIDNLVKEMTENTEPTKTEPKSPKGKWLINPDGYFPYCSECKAEPEGRKMTKFCPECGAYMGKP